MQILIPGTCEFDLTWQNRVSKNLEMGRLSWMSRVGPKHNHMYLYQRETEKVQRRKRKEDKRTMGSEIGMMQPQA